MSSRPSDVNLQSLSLFIRAGAGAGKTTQLIRSFGEFVQAFYEKHQRYPKVVITTFTRKATQEVKERLLVNALKESSREVFEYINKKSFVHISTIHGLLSLFLMQNTDALSLPQDLKIVDQTHSDRALRKSIHALMKRQSAYTELLEAYPFYRLVELSRQALDLRYQNRDLNFVSDEALKKLTDEKLKQVLSLLREIFLAVPQPPEKWQEYFLFLRNYGDVLKTGSVEDAMLLFADAPKKPVFSTKNPPFEVLVHEKIEVLRKEFVFQEADTATYRMAHQRLNQLFFEFLNELYQLDQTHKRKSGELTISDLENYSLRLIRDFPEVAAEFSNSWDFFMIDEYQDTSPLQVKILNEIVADRPCFIVGDPQQSIYLFRGARSEVFDQKEAELRQKNVAVKVLNTNYRSDPPLMSFMNDFFMPFKQGFKPMQLKESRSESQIQEQVFYVQTHDQIRAVLKQIQTLLRQGVSAQDICVLSRKNADLSEVAQLAYQFNIPVQLQAAGGFEFKREVLDLVAFLKFLVNPFDSDNLATLLRSPWVFVEDQALVDLAQPKEGGFALWMRLLATDFKAVQVLKDFLQNYEELGIALTLKKFILDTGFLAFSELLDPTGKREANIWKFLTNLSEAEKRPGFFLARFIEDQFSALQSDLGSSSGEAQPVIQPDRVSLMTVHASKGLEFKHVIVMGLTDRPQQTLVLNLAFDPVTQMMSLSPYIDSESKLLPSAWSTRVRKEFNQRELLESERVLYVAMTRAQQSVTLVAEVPKPDQRSTIVGESWFRKIAWPAESGAVGTYQIRAEFYDENLETQTAASQEKVQPRPKKTETPMHEAERHAVTDIISGLGSTPKGFQRQLENNVKALKKAQKGTDLHRLFESLKYVPLEELRDEVTDDEFTMLHFLLEQKHLDLKKILQQGYNEWGFGLQMPTHVLQGQIDAWGELDDEVHVLDYKTGSPEYADKAFDQLAIYTFALLKMKKISPDKKITHSVIYPVDQKIVKRQFQNAADFKAKQPALSELFQ